MPYTYQWRRCNAAGASCADIPGETNTTHIYVAGDVGGTVRVAANDGVTTETSDPSPVITATSPTVPSSYIPNKTFAGGAGTNVDAFLASLVPGDVAGLSGICIITASMSHAGTAANPIVVTSNNWASPATLKGRLAMYGTAAYWTYDYMIFDDNQTSQPTSWVVGGHHNIFRRLACTNHQTHIGFDLIYDSTYGQSHDNLIEQCRIYEIGPVTYDNRSHGVYNQGVNNTVQDCVIYKCSARGIQDRAATGGVYRYNTVADNRVGIIVGDLSGSHGLRGTKNIFAYSDYAGVRTYNNGSGSNNILDDNYVFSGAVDSVLQNLTCSNVHTADPVFTDRAARDYTLGVGSPATGYGPRTWPAL